IGAVALVLGAILTHAFTALREQRLEQLRQKQENYAQLINHIAEFVRNPNATRDTFESIHLYSWLVGSPSVIAFTQKFMKDMDDKTLENLLIAMRYDLGLPKTPRSVTIVGKDIFRVPPL